MSTRRSNPEKPSVSGAYSAITLVMAVAASSALASAPAASAQGGENTGSRTQEIRGGVVVDGFPGIVDMTFARAGRIEFKPCTGTMISQNAILAAAHCFRDVDADPVNGRGSVQVQYFDPDEGKRLVYRGAADWFSHPEFRAEAGVSAGRANSDIAVLRIQGRFDGTDSSDYLGLYAGPNRHIDNWLAVYGAGFHTYSTADDPNKHDGKLRMHYFRVENLKPNHIVFDTRKSVGICSGDSGGPAIYSYRSGGRDVPTVVAVGSGVELGGGEPDICSNNDWGLDDAFYSRATFSRIKSILEAAGQSCEARQRDGAPMVLCAPVSAAVRLPVDLPGGVEPDRPPPPPQDRVLDADDVLRPVGPTQPDAPEQVVDPRAPQDQRGSGGRARNPGDSG